MWFILQRVVSMNQCTFHQPISSSLFIFYKSFSCSQNNWSIFCFVDALYSKANDTYVAIYNFCLLTRRLLIPAFHFHITLIFMFLVQVPQRHILMILVLIIIFSAPSPFQHDNQHRNQLKVALKHDKIVIFFQKIGFHQSLVLKKLSRQHHQHHHHHFMDQIARHRRSRKIIPQLSSPSHQPSSFPLTAPPPSLPFAASTPNLYQPLPPPSTTPP